MARETAGKSARKFNDRHFPVRPDLDQLKHQAKDLLREVKRGDPAAIAELRKHHPRRKLIPPTPNSPTCKPRWRAVMGFRAGRDWSPHAG